MAILVAMVGAANCVALDFDRIQMVAIVLAAALAADERHRRRNARAAEDRRAKLVHRKDLACHVAANMACEV